jgi:hypothetical protein
MELSPEERQRIYPEEKARIEVQQELQAQKAKTAVGTLIIGFIVMGLFVLVVMLSVVGSMTENSGTTSNSSAGTPVIHNSGNPAHDRLIRLGPTAQALLLGRIAGEGCSGDSAFYMGMDKQTSAYWSIRCANGRSYEVQIQPDAAGSTSVMDCDVLKTSAKLSCFAKL